MRCERTNQCCSGRCEEGRCVGGPPCTEGCGGGGGAPGSDFVYKDTIGLLDSPRGVTLDGELLFVADAGNGRVLGFRVERPSGEPTPLPGATIDGLKYPTGVALRKSALPGISFLYVTDTANNRLRGYRVDRAAGTATPILDANGKPLALAVGKPLGVAFDGELLFVVANGSNDVLGYRIDRTTGAPEAQRLEGVTRLESPHAVAFDRRFLFVSVGGDPRAGNSRVLAYRVDRDSGATTRLPESAIDDRFTTGMALEGSSLFLTDADNSRLLPYLVEGRGSAPPLFLASDVIERVRAPYGVALDGTFLAVTWSLDARAGRVAIYGR